MLFRTTVSILSITLVGAVLVGGGDASGASKTLKASGPHIPKGGGLVNITGYSDNDGPKSTVILTGVIGDYGDAVRTYANGTTGGEFNQLEVLVTRGSFRLGITDVENKLGRAISGHFPTNTHTCSGVVTVTGATPVVTGSGTGAYKGLRGTFNMTITINEVESWPTCPKTDTSPFLAQSVFITGTGTVSL
jgi:hypothetical protein